MSQHGKRDRGVSIGTLRESAPQIVSAILLFVLSGFWGASNTELGNLALDAFTEYVQGLMGLSTPELIFAIFIRNAMAAGTAILFGAFFGLLPLAGIVFNGILIGSVLRLFPGYFWKLLPHGIFELPALFIAWGLGLWIGGWVLHPPRWQSLKRRWKESLRVYVAIVLPLLIAAAMIEGFAAHLYRG